MSCCWKKVFRHTNHKMTLELLKVVYVLIVLIMYNFIPIPTPNGRLWWLYRTNPETSEVAFPYQYGSSWPLVCNETNVCVSSLRFPLFFLFFFQPIIVDFVNYEQYICALFTVLQITLFSNFFIKNGFHNTIYTFENYFATVFSVSVFNFSKNKLNPNTPII